MNYNLLPWREAAIARRRLYLRWAAVLGVAFLFATVIIAIVVFHYRSTELATHQQELSVAIEAAKASRVKNPASEAVVSIQTPAGFRALLHQLFFGMADGVCLTSLHASKTGVVFHGQAPSGAALSHFLPAWPVSSFFSSLHLQSMNEDAVNGVTVFEVAARLAEEAAENDDADA